MLGKSPGELQGLDTRRGPYSCWNLLLNSITIAMVIGASPMLTDWICCGTLSSSTRKLPGGIPGMKWPLLSITATSSVTMSTSVVKVALRSLGGLLRVPLVLRGNLGQLGGFFLLLRVGAFCAGGRPSNPGLPMGPCCWPINKPVSTNSVTAHREETIQDRIGVLLT